MGSAQLWHGWDDQTNLTTHIAATRKSGHREVGRL